MIKKLVQHHVGIVYYKLLQTLKKILVLLIVITGILKKRKDNQSLSLKF